MSSGGACVVAGATDGGPGPTTDAAPPPLVAFGYSPANFDPTGLSPDASVGGTLLDCGESTFDTTSMTFGNWCGQPEPTPVVQAQPSGSDVVVVPFRSLTIASGATLRVTGSRPVILAVFGNATVNGAIDASASSTGPGPGGNFSCGTSQGGDGSGDPARFDGASGGGGGGFGTEGGAGGIADTDGSDVPGGIAGVTRGTTDLVPLTGGCAGGLAGGCSTEGGAGGGAVQLSAAGALTLTGTVRANGADGTTPCGSNDEGGGTGGGSGGGILLEATTLDDATGTTEVRGGRGGANGQYAGIYNCGGSNGGAGATDAASPGGNGSNCQGGSPGGGGGHGRIWTIQH